MDYVKLEKAMAEAKRFLEAAEKVQITVTKTYSYIPSSSKVNSACKRASLDLTRALAELRKG